MMTTGTKEWADYNCNFQLGCINNCRYCYAKKMAKRFNRIKTDEDWAKEIMNKPTLNPYRLYDGRIMYPTSHDIHQGNVKVFLQGLNLLLGHGNSVLITTKPRLETIKTIMEFIDRCFSQTIKNNVQFRFTITSDNNETLKFWEPGAPKFEERCECLKYAKEANFKTSVSIEPYLSDPVAIIQKIYLYATESIWVGVMNKRCVNPVDYERVKILYDKRILKCLIEFYQNDPIVRFKDSIQKLMKCDRNGVRPKEGIQNWV